MGWETARRTKAPSHQPAAVTAKLMKSGGHGKGRLLQIVLRAEVEARCAFLAGDARSCTVRVGTGALAGKIRIEPGETFRVQRLRLRPGMPLHVNLEPPHGVAGVFMASACRFVCGADWIEIELPDWCKPRGPELAGAPIAAFEQSDIRRAV